MVAILVHMTDRETILTKVTELSGDPVRAETWMREPIRDYGGRTAEELVDAGQGEAVLAFIADLERGAVG